MRFEIADVATRVELEARAARIARLLQCITHRMAVCAVARIVDLGFTNIADERPTAEIAAEMALLIAKCNDVNTDTVHRRILAQRACGFEGVDYPQRAVEPARLVLTLDVRTRENYAARAVSPEHIGDAVDLRIESSFGHPLHQPLPRDHIGCRQRRPVHTGLVATDLAERVKVT